MQTLEWKPEYSVGVSILDRQHELLLNIINKLQKINDADELSLALQAVLNYAYSHLRTEEKLMQEHNYPDFFPHLKEHIAFMARALEFVDRAEKPGIGLRDDALVFLTNWYRGHVLGSDRKYIDFFASKGVK